MHLQPCFSIEQLFGLQFKYNIYIRRAVFDKEDKNTYTNLQNYIEINSDNVF